jgi:hypothetical protein
LKALQWFLSWSEDEGMDYRDSSFDMYSTVEDVIVNGEMRDNFKINLVKKKDFLNQVKAMNY